MLIKGKGEVGFNLDGIYFEYVMKKDTALRLDVEALGADYAFDIYGAEDKDQPYYKEGMTKLGYESNVKNSKEKGFGIAFYFENCFESPEKLYIAFTECFKKIIAGT
jgi:hypothetical protein